MEYCFSLKRYVLPQRSWFPTAYFTKRIHWLGKLILSEISAGKQFCHWKHEVCWNQTAILFVRMAQDVHDTFILLNVCKVRYRNRHFKTTAKAIHRNNMLRTCTFTMLFTKALRERRCILVHTQKKSCLPIKALIFLFNRTSKRYNGAFWRPIRKVSVIPI